MAIHGYKGGVISATPPTTSVSGASGVWTTDDALQAGANWPVAPALVNRSLRFKNSTGSYLNRTPATTSNQKTWTWSAWVKRGFTGDSQFLFSCWTANNDAGEFDIYINPTGNLIVQQWTSSFRVTSAIYRDPSAWYHIVVAIDTTQATAGNRVKVYVNGSEVTSFSTTNNPTLNQNLAVNQAGAHYLSSYKGSIYYLEGYMTEVNFIDGQALTPNYFGATDFATGVWQPATYRGTYGTNGFYLPFTDTTSTTTLGNDFSGNGNNWTTNNISLTAGATYDSMTDVPTLTSATQANYPVLNPLANGSATITNGNLSVSGGNDLPCTMVCPPSGHWYVEFNKSNITSAAHIGVYDATSTPATINKAILYAQNGGVFVNNSQVATFATYGNNDIVGMGVDIDTGNIYFSVNNTYQGSVGISSSGIATNNVVIGVRCNSGVTADINFGQRPFVYPPTSPVKALNTFNLPTPTIGATASSQANRYFDIGLVTGSSSVDQTITTNFAPDFVWSKARNAAIDHALYDTIRGGTNYLSSNTTSAETTSLPNTVTFNSNGVTLKAGGSLINDASRTYVDWLWKANGTGVTNTAGSITSTVSANTTSGFSVVTATSNGADPFTVGHGLGVTPKMYIFKNRDVSDGWYTWHTSLPSATDSYLVLNSTAAVASSTGIWGAGATSTTIGIRSAAIAQNTRKIVIYAFAEVAGFSRFGSYTGNGSADGTFVYTGFRPKYLMIKNASVTQDWILKDSSRSPFNAATANLYPNVAAAEDNGATQHIDFLSNGFKLRGAAGSVNGSGNTMIFMAFAESPFKYANAR